MRIDEAKRLVEQDKRRSCLKSTITQLEYLSSNEVFLSTPTSPYFPTIKHVSGYFNVASLLAVLRDEVKMIEVSMGSS